MCHLPPKLYITFSCLTPFQVQVRPVLNLFKNGQVIEGRGYEGRVSLVTQELERGNVSLRLRDYRRSDRGGDICQVIYVWVCGPGRVIVLQLQNMIMNNSTITMTTGSLSAQMQLYFQM